MKLKDKKKILVCYNHAVRKSFTIERVVTINKQMEAHCMYEGASYQLHPPFTTPHITRLFPNLRYSGLLDGVDFILIPGEQQ